MVKLGNEVEVGDEPTRLAEYDAARTNLVLYNEGAEKMFIGTDQELTVANGLPIAPNGGNISIGKVFGSDPRLEYFGIVAATKTTDCRVTRSKLLEA